MLKKEKQTMEYEREQVWRLQIYLLQKAVQTPTHHFLNKDCFK